MNGWFFKRNSGNQKKKWNDIFEVLKGKKNLPTENSTPNSIPVVQNSRLNKHKYLLQNLIKAKRIHHQQTYTTRNTKWSYFNLILNGSKKYRKE